jgi:ATP-dependent helicase/nuclease subunit B
LQQWGQLDRLLQDEAGIQVAQVLRLSAEDGWIHDALWSQRKLGLHDFTQWVDHALEGAVFKPAHPLHEQVVMTPLAQMLGRSFGAVVLCGGDEQRLPATVEPAGLWTAAQRETLNLPSRQELAQELAQIWLDATSRPHVDILWRRSDTRGEPLSPSALVQRLTVWSASKQSAVAQTSDPRAWVAIQTTPIHRPAPAAAHWPVRRVSASAYQDLRNCPYKFFAQRMLGLREVTELESDIDKRDMGLWLHAVLQRFHLQPLAQDRSARALALDALAQQVAQEQHLSEDEFLPFLASWPGMREGYLTWLEAHEKEGWAFESGELDAQRPLGPYTLIGRIDRLDGRNAQGAMVIDYKTESEQTTRDRVKNPLEDTQLAFYAALMQREPARDLADSQSQDALQAAYLNISDRDVSRLFEQASLDEARDGLLHGLRHDLDRIVQGAELPALGEGRVCETCAVRGLCRKDMWSAS